MAATKKKAPAKSPAKAPKKSPSKGLGRGLDALLGDAPRKRAAQPSPQSPVQPSAQRAAAKDRQPATLPIEFLIPNAKQPRQTFDDEAMKELAASVKARGMLQPILVRPKGPDTYEIVAGERRWRAAQRAKLHQVPVIVRELNDAEAAEIALIENVQRVDLNPVEEAEAYQRLADAYGRTQEEIARAVGKSRSHVANIMRLAALPPKTRDALNSGAITMGHARALLSTEAPDVYLEAVLEENYSVRDTERLVQMEAPQSSKRAGKRAGKGVGKKAGGKAPAAGGPSVSRPKDADTRALENDLASALGLEVDINHSPKGAGAVTIKYLSLDQLDDVCRRLMGAGV